jgi:DNA-binding NtrC family response regulator
MPESAARVVWARAVRYRRAERFERAAHLCEVLARAQTDEAWQKVQRVVAASASESPIDLWLVLAGWEAQAQLAALELERAAAVVAGARVVAELTDVASPHALVTARRQVASCLGMASAEGVEPWVPSGTTRLAELWRRVTAGDRRACDTARMRGVVGPCVLEGRVEQWSEVTELWRQVQESASDGAVVAAACEWARVRVRAVAVAVLAGGGSRVVGCAGDPSAVRTDDALDVDVRYGAQVIATLRASGAAATPWAMQVLALAACACAPSVRARLDALAEGALASGPLHELLGDSPAMRTLRETILRVAPTGFPVLVEGESGVGKELVARAIHRASQRRDKTMASVNCAALTDDLFEAEVFGHARGAFTGAIGPRVGLFEDAHGGTLFLDEVAELSARGQAKLLRALQEGEVRRLGENQGRAVDVRIVAATNRPLQAAAQAGLFREDLVFRLAVVRVTVPPLRERAEDIPALASAAWARAVVQRPTRALLSADALAALCRYRWPGNVRELQNVMAALVLAAPVRGVVSAGHVAQVIDTAGESVPVTLASARRVTERSVVRRALARHSGCRRAAARELGVTRQGLAKLLARLGPDV